MGKIELAEHVVMHCATLLDDACVWHLGTKGMGTPAHRRGASQVHTVGCSRQMNIAVPRRETRSYFEA